MKSIKFVFVLQILVAVTLTLLVSFIFNYQYSKGHELESLNTTVENTAARLAVSLPPMVWDYNGELAGLTIMSELKTPEVIAVKVLDADGNEFVFLKKKYENGQEATPNESNSLSAGLVYEEYGEKNEVGQVTVYFDTRLLEEKLSEMIAHSLREAIILDIVILLLLIVALTTTVLRPLATLTERVKELSSGDGDLSNQLPQSSMKEFSELTENINKFTSSLRDIVVEVNSSSGQLQSSAENSGDVARANAGRLEQQKNQLATVAAAATELNHSVGNVASSAKHAADEAAKANSLADQVFEAIVGSAEEISNMHNEMSSLNTEMHKLIEEGDKINVVLNVINDISEQTNLLALNAAIEAARAGEQGRGFAVVAEEVRKLAVKTSESTEQIQSNIGSLGRATESVDSELTRIASLLDNSAKRVTDSKNYVEDVKKLIELISEKNSEISHATDEQQVAVEEISLAIVEASEATNDVSDGAQQNVDRAEEVLSACHAIASNMSKFRT